VSFKFLIRGMSLRCILLVFDAVHYIRVRVQKCIAIALSERLELTYLDIHRIRNESFVGV
jgi:hypothetical protein